MANNSTSLTFGIYFLWYNTICTEYESRQIFIECTHWRYTIEKPRPFHGKYDIFYVILYFSSCERIFTDINILCLCLKYWRNIISLSFVQTHPIHLELFFWKCDFIFFSSLNVFIDRFSLFLTPHFSARPFKLSEFYFALKIILNESTRLLKGSIVTIEIRIT